MSAVFRSVDLCCWLGAVFPWRAAAMGFVATRGFCLFICVFVWVLFSFQEVKAKPEGLESREALVSMATWMPWGVQTCQGHAPTNYSSGATAENFNTLSSFAECLLSAFPGLSLWAFFLFFFSSFLLLSKSSRASLATGEGLNAETQQKLCALVHAEGMCFLFH